MTINIKINHFDEVTEPDRMCCVVQHMENI